MSTFVSHHKYDLYATNSMQPAYSWRISQKDIRSMHSSRRPKTAECFCTENLRDVSMSVSNREWSWRSFTFLGSSFSRSYLVTSDKRNKAHLYIIS